MADCTSPTLSVPDLTCTSDLPTWATALVASTQAAIDHVVGCIQDFEYPTCDICVLKDDLVNCPLDVDMMDFTDIVYADEGGIGVLPNPLGGVEHRYGTGRTALAFDEDDPWQSVVVTFSTPFDTECNIAVVQITSVHKPWTVTSGVQVARIHSPIVQEDSITANGFTVWFKSDEVVDEADEEWVTFRYVAIGS